MGGQNKEGSTYNGNYLVISVGGAKWSNSLYFLVQLCSFLDVCMNDQFYLLIIVKETTSLSKWNKINRNHKTWMCYFTYLKTFQQILAVNVMPHWNLENKELKSIPSKLEWNKQLVACISKMTLIAAVMAFEMKPGSRAECSSAMMDMTIITKSLSESLTWRHRGQYFLR